MIKKLFAVAAATGLLFSPAGSTYANEEKNVQPGQKIERSLPAEPQAVIEACVASGRLTVRGWDKQEVRVRSIGAEQIEFRRLRTKDANTPPAWVEVTVIDKVQRSNPNLRCQAVADVEMDVPAGSTVHVQTRDGDIEITGVAAAVAGSQNGDIVLERITKLAEAGTVAGSISLKDSSGRMTLSSAGGGVEAMNVRGANADDTFEVGTVSGDIQLDGIANRKVFAKTVSGTMAMSGPLVKAGYYTFNNVTGDVLLELPNDASFRLNAKVSDKQDIVSDFVLKYLVDPMPAARPAPLPRPNAVPPADKAAPPGAAVAGGEPKKAPGMKEPKTPASKDKAPAKPGAIGPGPLVVIEKPAVIVAPFVRRVEAICGSGDATISVASFGGTVRLKKL